MLWCLKKVPILHKIALQTSARTFSVLHKDREEALTHAATIKTAAVMEAT